ncbi:hypothetical protein ABZ419_02545 [Streptomyces cinnamoneus]|uniref:hypothetical protein n=1 Tax=Streptomyces cinnamoneus TaxID=53446 RepID=UPI0033DCDD81
MRADNDGGRATTGHPMVAIYPGARVPAANVDTHTLPGPDDVLQVHVTRYPLEPPEVMWQEPETLQLHMMAIVPRPWAEIEPLIPESWSTEARRKLSQDHYDQAKHAESASIVVAEAGDSPPLLALDRLRSRYPYARCIGIIVNRHTVLVWLTTARAASQTGYLVTMTAADPQNPGPLSLYPSALYGWARWWHGQAASLIDERTVTIAELPPPPVSLDIVEAWRPYRVDLTGHDSMTFPAPPTPQRPLVDPDGPEFR